jgi:ParE toxin of type II toxin-antitoxin system, parDE
MTVRFSGVFKRDLLEAETRYSAISQSLGDEFHSRVKETTRSIIQRRGGDHVGPHGFPCKRCRPFPFLVYYQIEGDVLYVLGIVHTRRHPEYLKEALGGEPV